ncbi:SURF1 family protein [Phyllobacterium sp. LjRoot231]|uniref:SURF1 family protein n=1 Tax=Phyllobacterium sp. LjRoot231 TaxID=3342289 RepID=UPI003ECFAD01
MTATPAADKLADSDDKADRLGAHTFAGDDQGSVPNSPVKLCVLGIAALLGVIVLSGLGIWQLERRVWKLELIDHVQQRVHAVALPAPGPAAWDHINAIDDAYRHVGVTGSFLDNRETLVKAVTDRGGGFWVLAPFHTTEGFTVLVNRGFLPGELARSGWQSNIDTGAATKLTGLMRMTEPRGGFLRGNDPTTDRWYSRDVAAIAAARGIGQVAPYFIDADANANQDGLPVGGLTVTTFPNNHLVYALTWFAMALMLAAASVLIARRMAGPQRAPST